MTRSIRLVWSALVDGMAIGMAAIVDAAMHWQFWAVYIAILFALWLRYQS